MPSTRTSLRRGVSRMTGAMRDASPTPASPATTATPPPSWPPRSRRTTATRTGGTRPPSRCCSDTRLLVPVVAVLGEVEHDEQPGWRTTRPPTWRPC